MFKKLPSRDQATLVVTQNPVFS